MTTRKYSTGTKGRLKMHADQCRQFIHDHCPNFSIATEFISSIDPEGEDAAWQRFQIPQAILPGLHDWLGTGETVPPPRPETPIPALPQVRTASLLAADAALRKTREWIRDEAAHLASLSPSDAAEAAAARFHAEMSGKE